jgi:hypothetical protein
MTNFARNSIAAQTARPGGVAGVRPCDLSMFDADRPGRSGSLAGESYAAVLESHPRYPSLRRIRDAKLLARLDRVVEQKIKCVGLLQQFGFDEAGIALYHAAALSAFRASLPTN